MLSASLVIKLCICVKWIEDLISLDSFPSLVRSLAAKVLFHFTWKGFSKQAFQLFGKDLILTQNKICPTHIRLRYFLKTVILSIEFVFTPKNSILITYWPFVSINSCKLLQTQCLKETIGNK